MATSNSARPNFLLRIDSTQHATWQGELTWLETGEKVPFRSMLELVRLIDAALTQPTLPLSANDKNIIKRTSP